MEKKKTHREKAVAVSTSNELNAKEGIEPKESKWVRVWGREKKHNVLILLNISDIKYQSAICVAKFFSHLSSIFFALSLSLTLILFAHFVCSFHLRSLSPSLSLVYFTNKFNSAHILLTYDNQTHTNVFNGCVHGSEN